MEKVLEYTLREEDLAITAGGLVNLILKNCVRVTGHEISAAKFTRDGITCGGRTVHVSERILPGQTLRVVLPEDERRAGKILPVEPPEDLDILYEDEDLVIVNKSAGTAVHPSPGHYKGTMANYLAYHLQQQGQGSICRIIGRLDKETSGALVFAKNRAGAARLTRERQSGELKRTYLALVENPFPPDADKGIIDADIDRIPGVLLKRRIVEKGAGERAVTHYRVLNQSGTHALVLCRLETGRTHQIRLHMAGIGHPLCGDRIYGSHAPAPKTDLPAAEVSDNEYVFPKKTECIHEADDIFSDSSERAMLHAVRLRLLQPFTGLEISVIAPLPEDFVYKCRSYGIMVPDYTESDDNRT